MAPSDQLEARPLRNCLLSQGLAAPRASSFPYHG